MPNLKRLEEILTAHPGISAREFWNIWLTGTLDGEVANFDEDSGEYALETFARNGLIRSERRADGTTGWYATDSLLNYSEEAMSKRLEKQWNWWKFPTFRDN